MNNISKVLIYCFIGFAFGAMNNATYKLLNRLPPAEILTGRFLFATLSILPIILKKCKTLKTNNIKIHFARGLTELIALSSYVIGFRTVPLSNGTLIIFLIPFWVIIFSKIILNEKIEYYRIILASIIFIIILATLGIEEMKLNTGLIILLIGTIFSGFYDVLNKKCSITEDPLISLFYFNLTILAISSIGTIFTFTTLTKYELLFCITLGLGSNILTMCLLKAFSLSDASFVSTFRYLEFVYSVIIGIIIFNEKPNLNLYLASILVVVIQIIMTHYEKKHNNSQQKS